MAYALLRREPIAAAADGSAANCNRISEPGHLGRTMPGAKDGVHEPEHGSGGSGEPSDEVLAERVQRGDRDALELLVSRYLRPVHAVIASYLAELADVEDAAQDTFLRALDRIASYQPARPFAPWLYQIARNLARDRISANRRRRTEPLPDEGMAEPAPGPAVATERAEVRHLVSLAIDRLPEQRRTAFRLHDVEGYTTDEVARMMGLSPGTIRSHVHHARRALRTALATRFGDPSRAEG